VSRWLLGTRPTLGGKRSFAYDVNERGQIVGSGETKSGKRHAVLWEHGKMTDLGTLPRGKRSGADAINDRGQTSASSSTWLRTSSPVICVADYLELIEH